MGMVSVPARENSMCNGPVAPKRVIHEWGRRRSLVGPRQKGREWHKMALYITKIYKHHILYCPKETRIILFLSVPLSF